MSKLQPTALQVSRVASPPGDAALLLAERQRSGLLVALWLDAETATALALPGGEPAESLHCTLCFCGDITNLDELTIARAITAVDNEARWRSPIEGVVGGYGRFSASPTSDALDVFFATVDVPGLAELRQALVVALVDAGCPPLANHGWVPHITLAYLAPDAANPVESLPRLPLRFEGVTIMAGERRVDVPFAYPPTMPYALASSEPTKAAASTLTTIRPMLFSLGQEWIPFLPIPGNYFHTVYGPLDLTPDVYDRILANFRANVYGQDLPINCEHDARSSGAVGWIRDMRIAADGSLEVKPEWNDRGRALIDGDRFRYVSAEWFPRWQDPVTGEWHPDVAVGLAICTRPHFKTDVLRPLAASESAALARIQATDAGDPGKETPPMGNQNDQTTPATDAAATPATPTDQAATATAATDQGGSIKAFTDKLIAGLDEQTKIGDPHVKQLVDNIAREMAALHTKAERDAAEAKVMRETNAKLLAEHRVKLFTDEVMGRSPDNNLAYIGHIPDMVQMLCDLADKFGPDSWQVKHYQATHRAHAERVQAGELFKEIGSGRGAEATQTAYDQIAALASERVKQTGETFEKAFDHVLTTDHQLRAALAREQRTPTGS